MKSLTLSIINSFSSFFLSGTKPLTFFANLGKTIMYDVYTFLFLFCEKSSVALKNGIIAKYLSKHNIAAHLFCGSTLTSGDA